MKPYTPALAVFLAMCLHGTSTHAQVTPPAQPHEATAQPGAGIFDEPDAITRAVEKIARTRDKRGNPSDGWFLESGSMIPGSGFVAAGPGYRRHLISDRIILTTSSALSWRLYNMIQSRLDAPRLGSHRVSGGAQFMYQDALQVNFFGVGSDAPLTTRSGYRLRTTDLNGYLSAQLGRVTVRGRGGWLPFVSISRMEGREPAYPDTIDLFTEATAPGLTRQPSYLHGDLSVTLDDRNDSGRPTAGRLLGASWTGYTDLDTGRHSVQLLEVEATQYIPLVTDRWVIALRGWGGFTTAAATAAIPFYLMPTVGGKNTLRGFSDFRFVDRHADVFSIESRWGIFAHLDAAVFVDTGRVASTPRDLFSSLNTSTGFGLRLHGDRFAIARLDAAHSPEGWHLVFQVSEPFKRKTSSGGRRPVVPFVP